MRRVVICVLLLACTKAKSEGWRDVAGASDLAEPGTPILLEVKRTGGGGECGGGGCTASLGARALGLLPAKTFDLFYPDVTRMASARACPDAPDRAFEDWTGIAIAPARDGATPGCGLIAMFDGSMKTWVIVRIERR